MKKQNGFGLIVLLISIAIIAYIFVGTYSEPAVETGDGSAVDGVGSINVEKKSVLGLQLNSIKQAEESKRMIENRNILDVKNY